MNNSLLLSLFRDPSTAKKLSNSQWTSVLTHGRQQNMLGRLLFVFEQSKNTNLIPVKVKLHMENCQRTFQRQSINVHRELLEISNVFVKKGITASVLKGAAYVSDNISCQHGRIFSDIDILVEVENLQKAEFALMTQGWIHCKETDYDKRYYREWMHEIQPMIHNVRHTVVDLHHNILPRTNSQFFDANLLCFESSRYPNLQTLSPVDKYIHSAVHLFTEGEFSHPIRDITDLIMLFDNIKERDSELVNTQSVVNAVLTRAENLGLESYINFSLYFVLVNGQSDEKQNIAKVIESSICRSNISRLFSLPSYKLIFNSDNTKAISVKHKLSLTWLYLRSHLIKMPLRVLVPHLVRKFIFALTEKFKKNEIQRL